MYSFKELVLLIKMTYAWQIKKGNNQQICGTSNCENSQKIVTCRFLKKVNI